jgi:F0F1-type ATP synthase gamma subunit
MLTKKYIDTEIAQLSVLQLVARAYAQIASFRMRRMRENVLSTRDYLGEINMIFKEVLLSYRQEAEKIGGKNKLLGKNITFLAHNGRPVAVLLSANARLYGDLIHRTFDLFLQEVKDKDIEITIIGKYGLALFEDAAPDRPITYFDFPDSKVDSRALNSLISHLTQYEEIHFYYPEFQNVVTQKPKFLKLTAGEALETDDKQKTNTPKINYLFEPSLESVLAFFETQIFSSVLEQIVRESQLAKFASRLVAMDRTSEKVKEQLGIMNINKLKFLHDRANKKQLETIITLPLTR